MTLRVNRNWKNKREHPHHAEHADTGPFPSPRLPFHSCRHRLSLCGQKPPEFVAGPPTPARHHPQRPAGSDLPAGGGGGQRSGGHSLRPGPGTRALEQAELPLRGTEESDTLLDRADAGDLRLCAAPGDTVLLARCSLKTLGDGGMCVKEADWLGCSQVLQ